VTIAAVGSLVSARVTSGSTQTFTLAPTNATDVLVMCLNWQASTVNVSSVVTGSSGILWTPWTAGKITNSDLGSSVAFEYYFGRVQSTASQTTTITYSGAVTSARYDFQEFSTTKASPTWTFLNSSTAGGTTGTTMNGPSLTATAGALGFALFVVANTGAGSITGTGWTWASPLDSATNVGAYNLNTVAGTVARPVATQSPSGGWFAPGIVLQDVVPPPLWVPPGVDLGQF
jgi:hypothetical protein